MKEKVLCLDAGCGEDVFHQMFVDPGVALQPLPADSDDLRPLQEAHLQLKRHGYLPKVALGATLEGIPLTGNKGKTIRTGLEHRRSDARTAFHPFCVKSTFFSGRMERIWFRTWSGLV